MRADPRYRPQRTTGASYKPDDRAAASEATAVSAGSLTTPSPSHHTATTSAASANPAH
jgi:hypothetical protein